MGLIDTITSQIARLLPRQGQTTADELARPNRPADFAAAFAAARSRREQVQVCRQMYAEDPRAKGVIQTLARDTARGGFAVTVNSGRQARQAQEAADDLIKRLKLFLTLDDYHRLSARDGDSFIEVVVARNRQIVDLSRKPTLQMHRNSDAYDRFPDPARAYWLADAMWGDRPPEDAVWFPAWQIIHARRNHDEGSRYGTPDFASATSAYRRMTEGERDIAIRRKTRAGMKYIHSIDGDETDIETYKRQNRDSLANPLAAISDFFAGKKVTIQAVQGDARLAEIGDVTHHIETWGTASPVPLALLGYGRDINRDVLDDQKRQYNETLEGETQWLEDQIVAPLLELQWLLLGIWPGDLEYEIEWEREKLARAEKDRQAAEKAREQAEVLAKIAEAGQKLQTMGLPELAVAGIVGRLIHAVDAETDPADILKAVEQALAARPDEIERMAALANPPVNNNGNSRAAEKNGRRQPVYS